MGGSACVQCCESCKRREGWGGGVVKEVRGGGGV